MKKNPLLVSLILIIFFVISFLSNIIGPLVPDIINSFGLSLTMAAFLPFAFFVAYGVMSIPSWGAGIKPGVINDLGSTMDIFPTLLEMSN